MIPTPSPDPVSGSARAPQLLVLVSEGDREAFAALYDAYASRLFGLVLRVVQVRALAEEVTQETFLEIWCTADRFDPASGGALGWMLTIAHRMAVDRFRSPEASSRSENRCRELGAVPEADVLGGSGSAGLVRGDQGADLVRGADPGPAARSSWPTSAATPTPRSR